VENRVKNLHSAISEGIRIRQRLRLAFRAEALNTLNRVQFGSPNLGPTALSF